MQNMSKFEERESIILENQGEKIFGVIHRPVVEGKVPAVVFCHGFGGNKAGKYRLYVRLAQHLAQAGILAFRFDFRGSGDSEGDFADMTLDGEVSDAKIVLDYLLRDPQVDVNRIGIFGRSLGGVVAVILASAFGKAKSLALWAPAFNGKQWQDKWVKAQDPNTSAQHRLELQKFNGYFTNEKFLRQFFALKIEKDLMSLNALPLLHIHGEKDDQVNILHADEYSNCRRQALAQTKMIRLPNSDHDFSDLQEQALAIEETWKWFIETL